MNIFIFLLLSVVSEKITINNENIMTGFVYNSTEQSEYVITAGHIQLTKPKEVKIDDNVLKLVRLEFTEQSMYTDCAVYKMPRRTKDSEPAIFRNNKVLRGEKLSYFGFGKNKQCEVSVIEDTEKEIISFRPAPIPRDSGAPLLDKDGKVVGIVVMKIQIGEVEPFGVAVKSNKIIEFLKRRK